MHIFIVNPLQTEFLAGGSEISFFIKITSQNTHRIGRTRIVEMLLIGEETVNSEVKFTFRN
jgi:hypothetical protein